MQLVDSQDSVVGKCTETCRILDACDVDKVVRDCRWQESQSDYPRYSSEVESLASLDNHGSLFCHIPSASYCQFMESACLMDL